MSNTTTTATNNNTILTPFEIKRIIEVFSRFLEIKKTDLQEQLADIKVSKSTQKNFCKINTKYGSFGITGIVHTFFRLGIVMDVENDDDDDDFDDPNSYNWESTKVMCNIELFRTKQSNLHIKSFDYKDDKEYLQEQLEKCIKNYAICSECDSQLAVFPYLQCDDCYPFMTTYTEDCTICLSNLEGNWLKLECGHIFHKKCFFQIKTENNTHQRKCPLCREVLSLYESSHRNLI
jgi:hypothetical protein